MTTNTSANSVIVLDFETTGLSPNQGDRAIEIGAVHIKNGEIVNTFQQLMNPGFRVSGFIEGYTGITNRMLQTAAPCDEVMDQFCDFIGDHNLVAHNASFDQRFLDAELNLINRQYSGEFACSMLIARRLVQESPTHKLGDLVRFLQLENEGVFHRALADSEMTVNLWLYMINKLVDQHNITDPSFRFMQKISKTSKSNIGKLLGKKKP